MNELSRKARILWITARIKLHRLAMDSEKGVSERWKGHARALTTLCRARSELLTPKERRALERREGLV
ncbi:hypothetical protein [Marinobacter nauticus]|uniref:Uncharacterized protein n=1 Tax=Marinobacter nauticus TaxID=2743 RepID=A0A1M2V0V9_MARNT|nr:hypothetical protein [Marinobacter nauticus]OJT01210.1 hypothetical protein BEE62_14765 [Marinobacter nauticus]